MDDNGLDYTQTAQVAVAADILQEYGLSGETVRDMFCSDMAGVYMRLNTRGGDLPEYYQRVMRDRRASLIEVACHLFRLRIPPDPTKPKVLIRRRMLCQYTLSDYLPQVIAECAHRYPEDAAYYDWATQEIEALCRQYLRT